MIPDIEKVVAKYLRDEAAFDSRVVGKTPDSIADSWVRLTVLDGAQEQTSVADRNVAYLIQLDCYAGASGGQPEASTLARTVRSLIVTIADADHADAIVTGARITTFARIPDTGLEPARERFVITATVWAH